MTLGDWLNTDPTNPTGSVIDMRPIGQIGDDAPPAFGVPLPDMTGSILTWPLDPLGINSASKTLGNAVLAGSKTAGTAFGTVIGLAAVAGVVYVALKLK